MQADDLSVITVDFQMGPPGDHRDIGWRGVLKFQDGCAVSTGPDGEVTVPAFAEGTVPVRRDGGEGVQLPEPHDTVLIAGSSYSFYQASLGDEQPADPGGCQTKMAADRIEVVVDVEEWTMTPTGRPGSGS